MGFPLPYLLTAHGFRAERAAMAPHSDVGNQLPRDLHNTPAGSSGLEQNKIDPISQSKHPVQTLSWEFRWGREPAEGFKKQIPRERNLRTILHDCTHVTAPQLHVCCTNL